MVSLRLLCITFDLKLLSVINTAKNYIFWIIIFSQGALFLYICILLTNTHCQLIIKPE